MVAVTDQINEPSGLGHELMVEWGRWFRDDKDGRESWSAKPRIDHGYHGDPPESARFVDKLIAKHRLQFWNDWRVVAQYYLDDRSQWEIASRLGWSRARVSAILMMMCGMVEREYRDWRGMC